MPAKSATKHSAKGPQPVGIGSGLFRAKAASSPVSETATRMSYCDYCKVLGCQLPKHENIGKLSQLEPLMPLVVERPELGMRRYLLQCLVHCLHESQSSSA